MIAKIKHHSKYIFGMGIERFFLIGGVVMLYRGIKGRMMDHELDSREKFCYIACGVCELLAFIVPLALHGQLIMQELSQVHFQLFFWKMFNKHILYISVRYAIFTGIGWVFYFLSKPTQVKKWIRHLRSSYNK